MGVGLVLSLTLLGPAAVQAKTTTETLGDIGQIAVPAAGLAVAGLKHDGKGVVQLAESLGSTLALVYILKPTVDRTRPNGGSQSFPSGHAASAFAGAAFLQIRYGWIYGVPATAAAVFVGYSRVESKEHWTSDVVAGGAIGVAANLVFTRRYHNASLSPVVGPHTVGAVLTTSW